MTDLFGARPFKTVIVARFKALGERCTADDLVEAVRNDMTMAEYEKWAKRSFRAAVVAAAKSRPSKAGVDAVMSNKHHQLVSVRLFSVEEFVDEARLLARQSRAARESVYHLARICQEVHQRSFDPEEILREAGVA